MQNEKNKPQIGISACLMGQKVRFDGGHKQSGFCRKILSEYFNFTPLCPEVAIGMSVPRHPIRLVSMAEGIRVRGTRQPELDVTQQLTDYGSQVHAQHADLSGYILMKGSPSCGMERVKVYQEDGSTLFETSAGAFAKRLMELNPLLPVEEDGRLNDPVLRENFINRVYVYHHWQVLHRNLPSEVTLQKLQHFHRQHKFIILSHQVTGFKSLGQFLAKEALDMPIQQAADAYILRLMDILKVRANRKGHANVMMQFMRHLKHRLDPRTKQDLLQLISDYRQQKVNLSVPITMINHYLARYGSEYTREQRYLSPYPYELGLRNQI